MKYFTKAQIEEIRKQLATLGVRDTDLPDASKPLSGEELVAIVQDGENRKVGIKKLIHDYLPDDISSGEDGASAYEIWRNQPGNYNKSVQDFLDSLKGEKGDTGAKGNTGATGPAGPAGVTAATAHVGQGDGGSPSVNVTKTGTTLDFEFKNLGNGSGSGSDTNTWRGISVNGSSFKGSDISSGAINFKAGSNITLSASGNDLTITATGGGGGDEGGDDGESGSDGRSITGVDMWFKLSASTNESAPDLSIADPSSYAAGRWSLTADHPTAQLPYLWAFMQINYDQVGPNGYAYSRSAAYIARNYNASSSEEFASLEAMIESLRSDMESDMAGYEADLLALNTSLQSLRSSIEGSITTDINTLKSRFTRIDGTDVKRIEDNANGLWGVMTSYQDDTNGQKSFSDILLDARNAKNTLSVGSEFFGNRTGAEIDLDGIKGQIALKASKDYVDSSIASAQFSVDPSALTSVISKGQKVWIDGDNVLYPYNYHLDDGDFTPDQSSSDPVFVQYEDYMESTSSQGGPSDGPFTLASVVSEFSTIKQTVDGFSASVNNYRYMWELADSIYAYDYFESDWEDRPNQYRNYSYESYVTSILHATKVEVSNVLSNFTQTSDEIRSTIGDMGYVWRKENANGSYSYQRYAVPANRTRDWYVNYMENAGWSLYDYATKFSVIDQTADSITFAIKNAEVVWIKPSLPASSENYSLPYDYWYEDYLSYKSSHPSYSDTYEEYVSDHSSGYQLENIAKSFSEIKQQADRITSAVEDIDDLESTISGIQQTAEEIALTAGKTYKAWKNSQGDIQTYDSFKTEWENSGSALGYEQWVQSIKSYSLFEVSSEIAGLKVRSDKIWAGVSSGNDVAASIEILANARTAGGGSKIILDADNVQINGGLQVGVVGENQVANGAITSTKIVGGAITTGHIASNAITTDKIDAGAITADKIDTGAITTDKLAAGSITADKLAAGAIDVGNLTVDDLLASNATITRTFTAEDIRATGGKIGALDINQYGLYADINRSTSSYFEDVDFELTSSKLKYVTEFFTRSSGGSTAGVSVGAQTFAIGDRQEVGFVTIRDSTDYPGPVQDCAVYIYAPDKDAVRITGNVSCGNLTAGYLYNRAPVQSVTSSPLDVSSDDSGKTYIINGGPASGSIYLEEIVSQYYSSLNGTHYDFVFASYTNNTYTIYTDGSNTITAVMNGSVSQNLQSYTLQNGYSYHVVFCGGVWYVTRR